MGNIKGWLEFITTKLVIISGYSAILFVFLIFFFLLNSGLPALREVQITSLLSQRWYPIEDYFGLLPLIIGSIIVTIGAALIAVPIGIAIAIFIAEIAPDWARDILKPIVEVLGGIPSVILGFLGILIFAPFFRRLLDLPTGLSAFTGALLLGAISIPTIASIAEDALDAVPQSFRDASLALGTTEWQTIWFVTLPAARSGVLTAIMLGIGRAFGETMAVMMVTGNAPVIPSSLSIFFSTIRTMTATIAAEMGEVAAGSTHYNVLFMIGIILFLIELFVNITASSVILRQRKRTERILS